MRVHRFDKYDRNKDGALSMAEFKEFFRVEWGDN